MGEPARVSRLARGFVFLPARKDFMKKVLLGLVLVLVLGLSFLAIHSVQARGRYGSFRVGGYTSSGKGSHYVGGYVRSCRKPFCW
jgi:hypothetical protein